MNRLWLLRCFHTGNSAASWMRGLLILLCLLTIPACSLFNWSTYWLAEDGSALSGDSAANVLGKIPTSRAAVEVEIIFVERPVGDPLLGSALWDEVDQIGALPVADRKGLAELGFRWGRVGANPPRALQTLMGLAAEVGNDDEKRLAGRRIVLPSGAETEITAGPPLSKATIHVPTSSGGKQKTFENVRGVFRLKTKQLQDGWARVEFLPEIHHGRMANRPTVIRGGWQVHASQDIDRLYRQRFSLDLNLGEMVIITGEMEPEDSLGRQFFYAADFTNKSPGSREEDETDPSAAEENSPASPRIQRLLIVRLADLRTAEALYPKK